MGFNNAAMAVGAAAIKAVCAYAQLHSGPAGAACTANVTTAARLPVTWGATTGAGDFSLGAQLDFTGGEANGDIHSITLWSASTAGTAYGEFVIADAPDTPAAFNSSGDYSVTSLDLDGSAS